MTDHKIATHSGKLVDPFSMRYEDLSIEDIAHALSNQCRFSGHTSEHYSIARHSLAVAQCVDRLGASKKQIMIGLMHDASEAYLLDVPSPLKSRPEFAFYRDAERKLQSTIFEWLGLNPSVEDLAMLARGDFAALKAEAITFMGSPKWANHIVGEKHALFTIGNNNAVKGLFIDRFNDLAEDLGIAWIR